MPGKLKRKREEMAEESDTPEEKQKKARLDFCTHYAPQKKVSSSPYSSQSELAITAKKVGEFEELLRNEEAKIVFIKGSPGSCKRTVAKLVA